MKNISFIILSPLRGYRDKNKRYLKMDVFKENIQNILSNFYHPDIVVITGGYTREYIKKREKFRICENQLFNNTGEIEQIRLGFNNIVYSKIVIMKEDANLSIENIKRNIKKRTEFVLVGSNNKNPGMIIQENRIQNISFGLHENYFGDFLYLENRYEEVVKFINMEHNKNKTLHELANYLINSKPILAVL